MNKKNAIALLITMFFIMAITVTIGIALKHVNEAKENVSSEQFLLQTNVILEDMLKILKNSPQLNDINDSDSFRAFLTQYSMSVPLTDDIIVDVQLESARSKFNINAIKESHTTKDALFGYFNAHVINTEYVYILEDLMSGMQTDGMYKSALFNEAPTLFRNYISSDRQIKEANRYYKKIYHDNNVDKINLHDIFNFGNYKISSYIIDLNFVNRNVFNIMSGIYNTDEENNTTEDEFIVDCTNLSQIQKQNFKNNFNASCDLQKIIAVTLDISSEKQNAVIKFEYDMTTKKGYNFVYKI